MLPGRLVGRAERGVGLVATHAAGDVGNCASGLLAIVCMQDEAMLLNAYPGLLVGRAERSVGLGPRRMQLARQRLGDGTAGTRLHVA